MGHDRDIQGRAWQPCPTCPHATPGSCPSRRHRAYCEHHAAEPETWGPIIAGLPACDDPGRDVTAEPYQPADRPIDRAVIAPDPRPITCVHHGGPVPGMCCHWFWCSGHKKPVTANLCPDCDLVQSPP